MKFGKLVVIVLSCCAGIVDAQPSDSVITWLVCEFEGGIGLNHKGEVFTPSKEKYRFEFQVPSSWLSDKNRNHSRDTKQISWRNLIRGWDGEGTALFMGDTISIVENNDSDNGFYVAIWPIYKTKKGQMQSILVNVGHGELPAGFEASNMRIGHCDGMQ